MSYDPYKHYRRSMGLKGFVYSWAGAYFVAICIQGGRTLLGQISDGEMGLNPAGEMVREIWQGIPEQFKFVERYQP